VISGDQAQNTRWPPAEIGGCSHGVHMLNATVTASSSLDHVRSVQEDPRQDETSGSKVVLQDVDRPFDLGSERGYASNAGSSTPLARASALQTRAARSLKTADWQAEVPARSAGRSRPAPSTSSPRFPRP